MRNADDLAALRTLVRRYATEHHVPDAAREGLDQPQPHDPHAWGRLSGELGLVEVLRDASWPRLAALAAVQEELGRVLAATPWFATVTLAGTALTALGADAVAILDGRTAALAIPADPLDDTHGPDATVDAVGRVNGAFTHVVDADSAQVLVVPARSPDGVAVCLMDPADVELHPHRAVDGTRPTADVRLRAAPGEILAVVDPTRWAAALDEVAVPVAADMLGAARACLDRTVDHARQRHAFGRPIGSFQALKHALADLHVDVEGVAALVAEAARAHDEDDPASQPIARMALAEASEVLLRVADAQVRLHGGIGFTWEHDAHLYLRRATALRSLLGRPDQHWDRVATLMGLAAG